MLVTWIEVLYFVVEIRGPAFKVTRIYATRLSRQERIGAELRLHRRFLASFLGQAHVLKSAAVPFQELLRARPTVKGGLVHPVAHHQVSLAFGLGFQHVHAQEPRDAVNGVRARAEEVTEAVHVLRLAVDGIDGDKAGLAQLQQAAAAGGDVGRAGSGRHTGS